VRVIAATNRNVRAEVNARRFRSDLYYRLGILEVTLPPLRNRVDDLPILVDTILTNVGVEDAQRAKLSHPEFLARLARYDWPGNVRELRNYLERCLAFGIQTAPEPVADSPTPKIDARQPLRVARERYLRAFERQYLTELLRLHDDNVSAAARAAR